jgi:topoisomerase-4 subunit A
MGKSLVPPGGGDDIQGVDLKKGAGRALSGLCVVHHHGPRPARRARWPQAGPSPHSVRHARTQAQSAVGFKKCAKIVGEVMGNFHPHGDQAIYDALVRLAQDSWSATRWSTARETSAISTAIAQRPCVIPNLDRDHAELLLQGIDEDTVDFKPTYDELQTANPWSCPARSQTCWPTGATGIAVGMATIDPAAQCRRTLRCGTAAPDPQARRHDGRARSNSCPGPDFPTGGVVIDTA